MTGKKPNAQWKRRCPECGEPVKDFFDHVDRDCTDIFADRVKRGELLPPLKKES